MRTLIALLLLTGLTVSSPRAEEPNCPHLSWIGFSEGTNAFFRPMLADIRAPVFNARYLRALPVPFTVSSKTGKHNFADISFGGDFLLIGKQCMKLKPEEADKLTPAQVTAVKQVSIQAGWGVMLDTSIHSLFDIDTSSMNLINTDFRIGLVAKYRPSNRFNHFSYRFSLSHESTHLGDEYLLEARNLPGFARYNVSHEMIDATVSFDNLKPFRRTALPVVYRFYGGLRYYLKPETFADYDPAGKSLQGMRLEQQAGLETFWEIGASFPRLRNFNKLLFAVDLQRRSRYAVDDPGSPVSVNVILGLMTGDYLGNGRAVKYYLSYYNGVNPHGQFRMYHANYLGFNLGYNF